MEMRFESDHSDKEEIDEHESGQRWRDRRDLVGGILVIIGIVLMFVWSFWIGLIVALVGLIAFGGFARGKWY